MFGDESECDWNVGPGPAPDISLSLERPRLAGVRTDIVTLTPAASEMTLRP